MNIFHQKNCNAIYVLLRSWPECLQSDWNMMLNYILTVIVMALLPEVTADSCCHTQKLIDEWKWEALP